MERMYHSDVNIVCLSAFCRRPRNENLMSQFYFNVEAQTNIANLCGKMGLCRARKFKAI